MAVAACAFLLRYAQFLDRLLPDGVERVGLVSYPYESIFCRSMQRIELLYNVL